MLSIPKVVNSGIVLFALASCASTGQPLGFAQGEAMERQLLQCKQDLGFGGQTRTVVEVSGGLVTARVVPFDQIDEAAAAQINACATGANVLEDGMVVVPMTAEPAQAPAQTVEVAPAVATSTPSACPVGYRGLYRGTLYCNGGL